MNFAANSFGNAGRYFSLAYNDMTQASDDQKRVQTHLYGEGDYERSYDDTYMEGDEAPKTGIVAPDVKPSEELESVKRDLLRTARERHRESDGSVYIRAGGGTNPAIRS